MERIKRAYHSVPQAPLHKLPELNIPADFLNNWKKYYKIYFRG